MLRAIAIMIGAALAFWAVPVAYAGSCCGGGSGAGLIVPRYATSVIDLSLDTEIYSGFWNEDGKYTSDPDKSDLRQYRLNFGYGRRLLPKLQMSAVVPYVRNDNKYSGLSSESEGLGDMSINLWYEALSDQTAWKVRGIADMVPSITMGLGLVVPTGISPYDNVSSSFDVTGRGFYRVDANVLIDKTVQPYSVSLALSYGRHIPRDVNREYDRYVEPYTKALGDRASGSLSAGRNFYVGTGGDTLTANVSYAYVQEAKAEIDGARDDTSGFNKQTVGGGLSYSSTDHDWSVRLGVSHALRYDHAGENFPVTDVYSIGVRYVIR